MGGGVLGSPENGLHCTLRMRLTSWLQAPFPLHMPLSFWHGLRSIERVNLMAYGYPYPSLGAPEKEGF